METLSCVSKGGLARFGDYGPAVLVHISSTSMFARTYDEYKNTDFCEVRLERNQPSCKSGWHTPMSVQPVSICLLLMPLAESGLYYPAHGCSTLLPLSLYPITELPPPRRPSCISFYLC